MQRDDVHGGHGQTGTVHHAADVSVHLDVVEAELGGANLSRIGLAQVLLVEDRFLTELGVVVKVQLGVKANNYVKF